METQSLERKKFDQVLRKATSKGTLQGLQCLADPRVIAHVNANQEEYQQVHLLVNKLIQQWKSALEISEIDERPERLVSAEISSPSEAIANWKDETLQHYDEIFDGESLRPAYQEVYPICEKMELQNPSLIDKFEKKSLRDFMNDNKLYHIPRMLTISEHENITRGVEQRAKAIQCFLQDYLENDMNAKCFTENIIPPKTFKQILYRNHEQTFSGDFNKKLFNNWGFWYGPDLIRGPTGQLYVCEDNIGFVGGLGDLDCARQSLLKFFPELGPAIRGDTPKNFYQSISREYFSMVKSNERVVLLHYPNSITADNEEKRVIKLFHECGIDTVVLSDGSRNKKQQKRTLEVKEDGSVELVIRRGFKNKNKNKRNGNGNRKKKSPKPEIERHPVGLVIIDAEAFDVDPKNSSVKRKIILDEAQNVLETYDEILKKIESKQKPKKFKLKKKEKIVQKRETLNSMLTATKKPYGKIASFLKEHKRRDFKETLEQGISGLLDSYFTGKVQIINGPGFDFLGDKMFCMFVAPLIRLYLKEEPIIAEIPTFSFADKQGKLDQTLFSAVFNDTFAQQSLVLKRVDGRGGDAVWVGPKISRAEFDSVQSKIQAEPSAFIVQKYLALSVVDNQLVDLRNLANVTHKNVIVSDVLWGRGVPVDGSNGKVNISDAGFEFAVCRANV